MTFGIYAANGSINVTVVDGTTFTGLYARDGSWNVVVSDGIGFKGRYHPCGGYWVTNSTGPGFYAADGSMNVSETAGAVQRVTVISGSLSGGVAYVPTYQLVANHAGVGSQPQVIDAASTRIETRLRHTIGGEHVSEFYLVYGNWYVAGLGIETYIANTWTLEAAVELADGSQVKRALFRGTDKTAAGTNTGVVGITSAVAPTGLIWCGPVVPADFGLTTFKPGMQFFSRTGCTAAVADLVPWGDAPLPAVITGEITRLSDSGATSSQIFATGAMTNGSAGDTTHVGPAPMAIVGKNVSQDEISVAFFGDSHFNDAGDGSTVAMGFTKQAAYKVNGRSVPWTYLGRSTSQAANLKNSVRTQELWSYCTHFVTGLATNDISNGHTAATVLADQRAIYTSAKALLRSPAKVCQIRPYPNTSCSRTIAAITKGVTTTVDTTTPHLFTTGQTIFFSSDVGGMTQIRNLSGTITSVDADTFTINIDSSAFSNFTSGGTVNNAFVDLAAQLPTSGFASGEVVDTVNAGMVEGSNNLDKILRNDNFYGASSGADSYKWVPLGTTDGTHATSALKNATGAGTAQGNLRAYLAGEAGAINTAPTGLTYTPRAGFTVHVDENTATTTAIGDLSATDAQGQAITWSLVTDADNKFAVSSAGVVTLNNSLDYETKTSHQFTARATDVPANSVGGALTADITVTIQVGDISEPSEEAETTALFNQMAALGATSTTTGDTAFRTLWNNYIAGTKSDGDWANILAGYCLHIPSVTGAEANAARPNFKAPGTTDLPAPPWGGTFTAKTGYDAGGTNANKITTGIVTNTAITDITNSGMIMVLDEDSPTALTDMGGSTASGFDLRRTGTSGRTHLGSVSNANYTPAAAAGFTASIRENDANNIKIYTTGGTLLQTVPLTSTGTLPTDFCIAGGLNSGSDRRGGIYIILQGSAGSLNAAKMLRMRNRLVTLRDGIKAL